MSERAIQTGRATNLFPEAERVVVKRQDGTECPLVVLSVLDIDGNDVALVCPESELGSPDGLLVFAYATDADGAATLSPIDDDDIYDEAFHCFADLFVEDVEE